ncbi:MULTISPECIES: D-alanine--D-alanine ligase [unclassified Gilliamella]|uniref:D-alanine--D-alanine ligase n=1 Tax=unclassified Gilliamella TaxID=2685620 RepID=UPI00226AB783|nr:MULTISPECIES: D-alanine--D-alanine ligase [unclassified Gilliamella]MCX8600409.1 D-alanine--D-alanine ligase [Gilliamella sp. B3722]MCX8609405.1 D-alanine--D-alanine ligase [Gilliamella sp. B3771]MCX8609624.1 D-alanine--D-alanine ligase [Gilliamella sp. B3891]MCX8612287.1 D-alanine--D-alanine ligase [Gilliamella sp. B3773]MCX8615707.1 D-alanine--D-alanine ligase [Gilliamella sp. B3770]
MVDKVAVLYGGTSAEREVSLKSGKAVLAGLLANGIDAHLIDTKDHPITSLKDEGYTKAFIILHGRGGEDGIAQAILTYQKIPYTGSDVLSSALTMDKLKTKLVWKALGLPVADYVMVDKSQSIDVNAIVKQLNLPLFVKPSHEGSSVGMTRVNEVSELKAAIEVAFQYDDVVMVESFLAGPEFTVAIVGEEVLPSIYIKPATNFYDYDAKYLSDSTQYFCPSGLTEDKEREIRQLALEAYKAVGCRGWGRVDIMFDQNEKPYLLEVNTAPGMTDHSLVPMAAKQHGWSFSELVNRILNLATI